jgi:predicted 3-demethylubiquinone-9 3-methyltransferase (glyoxalase superfamily)/uncharacterized protein YndB with AHSA1/START domain
MEPEKSTVMVDVTINAPIEKVWECWTKLEHVIKWNFASDDWHCPSAENELKEGGKFSYTMSSKDGKMSFDFEGEYNLVIEQKKIIYTIADGRKVKIDLFDFVNKTKILEIFEAEGEHTLEQQQEGWQKILDNFKKYVESTIDKASIVVNTIVPCLWFDKEAEQAAKFYTSIFNNSKIINISYYTNEGKEIHGQQAGSVLTVEFQINGQKFTALNGGPIFKFNEAVSFQIFCETQDEIDFYWSKLTDGGEEGQCGWLKDKYGVSWQIVPSILPQLISNPEKAEKVTKAFMQMQKFDIKAMIEAAQ